MSLGKSLTLGSAVRFNSKRHSRATAFVTAIKPAGESRRVSLHVFPAGGTSFAATGIEHVSLADPGAESWDFLDASATVAL